MRLNVNEKVYDKLLRLLSEFSKDEIAMVEISQTEGKYIHGYSMRPLKNKLYTHQIEIISETSNFKKNQKYPAMN